MSLQCQIFINLVYTILGVFAFAGGKQNARKKVRFQRKNTPQDHGNHNIGGTRPQLPRPPQLRNNIPQASSSDSEYIQSITTIASVNSCVKSAHS